jgi:hypothetical protein
MKLMDAKKSIKEGTIDSFSLPTDISRQLKDANKARTKKLFGKALILIRGNCLDKIELANNEIVKLNETKKETKLPSKVAETKVIVLDEVTLARYAEDIKSCISQAMQAHFVVGRLLSEALDMFKEAKKPAKDWLAWANTACQIKKAQAYNLVKIYGTFGDDSDFKNCSMRVLNVLVHLDAKLFDKLKDQASELAKEGKLTTKQVNKLIDLHKPAPAEPKEPKAPAEPVDRTGQAMQKEAESNNNEIGQSNVLDKETSKEKSTSKEETSELEKLRAENEALKAQLKEMNETLRRLEKKADSKPSQVAPFLPQFTSKAPNIVLGVTLGAGPAEVNRTYREMAKIFNASTCPDGAKALKAAKEELLKGRE